MHHNTSLDALSTTFIKTTCIGQAWVGSKYDFAGNSWWHVKQVEQGSMDMTQSKSIKWKDQQCKQRSGRERLGGATSGARGHESHKGEIIALKKIEPGRGTQPPGPVGPGRPACPIKGTPRCLSSAGKQLYPSSICVLKFLCPVPP
jgi:hypothetical protein